jgi:SAM-dependent methyltransferase
MAKKETKGRRKRRTKGKTMAELADRFDLYQRSVQGPEADVEVFDAIFRDLRGRAPRKLREDFCGTGYLSTTWAASAPGRTAVGIDLDQPTLDWGLRHNVEPAGEEVASRVRLLRADVRDGRGPRADIVCALNFSFCVFKERAELRHYFETVHDRLVRDGLFFAEIYGGSEAVLVMDEERKEDGFKVIWDQAVYNPITHETLCHLHFKFRDGSRLDKAFTYDWRLWGIPEIREIMAEAGFAATHAYWEQVDDDGDGTGEYEATEEEENQETWLVYVVGVK